MCDSLPLLDMSKHFWNGKTIICHHLEQPPLPKIELPGAPAAAIRRHSGTIDGYMRIYQAITATIQIAKSEILLIHKGIWWNIV
jgi:hypothetical protein